MDEQLLASLEEKWINGTISQDEMELYASWYNSQQNEPFAVPEAIATNKEAHRKHMMQAIEAELARVDPQFKHTIDRKNRRATIKTLVYVAGAAAAVFLGVVLCVQLFSTAKVKQAPAVAVADVHPGHAGLVLQLNNGQAIQLDSMQDGVIWQQDGVKVIKENGSIRYEGVGKTNMYNTAVTNASRRYQVQLPDGSTVWLNAASELKYPLAFSNSTREVLLKGEAYFEVSSVKDKRPFIVNTDGVAVKVLGTKFNVNAYGNEPVIATTLLEGRIMVSRGSNEKLLQPNQAAIAERSTQALEVKEVKAAYAIGWIENKFVFENMTLEEVMRSIERWYGIPVVIKNGVDRKMVFSGATPMNQNLSEVLKVLSLSGVNCSLHDGTLFVTP